MNTTMHSAICRLVLFSIMCLSFNSFGQTIDHEIITTTGDYFTAPGISLSWTAGETATETISNESVVLTQGFQQSQISLTAIGTIPGYDFEIKVYPNPAVNYVNIEWPADLTGRVDLRVYDINGVEVVSEQADNGSVKLDFAALPAATYLLIMRKVSGEPIRNYLINKTK